MMTEQQERRRTGRLPYVAEVRWSDGSATGSGVIRNLSASGVLFKALEADAPPVGTSVALDVAMDSDAVWCMSQHARVVRRSPPGAETEVAAKFDDL